MSKNIILFDMDVITYPCPNPMQLSLISVCKRSPGWPRYRIILVVSSVILQQCTIKIIKYNFTHSHVHMKDIRRYIAGGDQGSRSWQIPISSLDYLIIGNTWMRNKLQWNLYNETEEILLKHPNFVIYLTRSLQNHVYPPCRERPPVLRDHKM